MNHFNEPKDDTSLSEIFSFWLEQAAYPLITITQTDSELKLTQTQFPVNPKESIEESTFWYIPLDIKLVFDNRSENELSIIELFPDQENHSIELPSNNKKIKYFLASTNQVGYYRINYDVENWLSIKSVLNSTDYTEIRSSDRAQIVSDLFNLARTEFLEYNFTLDILEYMVQETEYVVWKSMFNELDVLYYKLPEENTTDYHDMFNVCLTFIGCLKLIYFNF